MQIEIHQLEPKYAALRIADPERQSRLTASMLRYGQTSPVLVVLSAGTAQYVLIDGYARVAALRGLAHDLVEAVALEVSEPEALMLRHRLSATRPCSALEEGWLIEELKDRHGKNQEELAIALHRSASWVSRRLGLVRVLPEAVQEAIRQGVVPAYAATKYLVPLARANRRHSEQLVTALGAKRISVRQMQRLYEGWLASDAQGRENVVRHPHLYLKANEEPAPPAPEPPPTPLAGELESVAALCRRVRRELRAGILQRISPTQQQQIRTAWQEAQGAFQALAVLIDPEERDARRRHPECDPEAAPREGSQHSHDRQGPAAVSQRGAAGAAHWPG